MAAVALSPRIAALLLAKRQLEHRHDASLGSFGSCLSSHRKHSVKLAIFDFDGTLADSRKLIIESNRIVYGQFGLVPPSEEESFALVGMSLELVLLRLVGPDAPVEKMIAAYQQVLPMLRADVMYAEVPFEGSTALLAALSDEGVQLGIATGHPSYLIAPVLRRFGWQGYFSTVQSADKAPSKPHPGMILQALRETNVAAADAIMIGDTAFDIEMATAAGVRDVAVSWGYHRHDRLRDAGASCVVHNMRELSDYLLECVYRRVNCDDTCR
jgi:phosphoglycolate phosphatase